MRPTAASSRRAPIAEIRRDGGRGMLGLVGVQSNQFPRAHRSRAARSLPRASRSAWAASTSPARSPCSKSTPPEIAPPRDMGISYFIGEAEDGRLDEVLIDGYAGKLKPLYDYRDQNCRTCRTRRSRSCRATQITAPTAPIELRSRPRLPVPVLVLHHHQRAGPASAASAPPTISSRIVRDHRRDRRQPLLPHRRQSRAQPQLGACFDRLIELQREEKASASTCRSRSTRSATASRDFIEKAVKAGIDHVFVGHGEHQSRQSRRRQEERRTGISEYREMFLAWKKHPVVITAGYIIGFPNDTRESILHDVEVIKRELPIDLVYLHQSDAAAGLRGPPGA